LILFVSIDPQMTGITNRFPCMENAEIRTFINGPESFTPDGQQHVYRSIKVCDDFREIKESVFHPYS